MKKIATLIAAVAITTCAFAQNTFTLDKNHARLGFSVVHLGISHIEGNFNKFDATLVSSKDDFSDAQIDLVAEINSFNTGVEMRDTDLRENWFEAKKYPTLTFKSTSFKKDGGKNYKLKGNITMHGVTKPIEFDVVYNGKAKSPFTKKDLYGFTISGKLNRGDFSVGGEPMATGVSNEVELKANVEFSAN